MRILVGLTYRRSAANARGSPKGDRQSHAAALGLCGSGLEARGSDTMLTMLVLHATRDCGQTPRIVFAFEELAAPWRVVWHDAGYFLDNFGGPGPLLEDGEIRLFYSGPIIRHAARTVGGGRLLPSAPNQLAI